MSSLQRILGIKYIVFNWGIDWILVERLLKLSNGFLFAIFIFHIVVYDISYGFWLIKFRGLESAYGWLVQFVQASMYREIIDVYGNLDFGLLSFIIEPLNIEAASAKWIKMCIWQALDYNSFSSNFVCLRSWTKYWFFFLFRGGLQLQEKNTGVIFECLKHL